MGGNPKILENSTVKIYMNAKVTDLEQWRRGLKRRSRGAHPFDAKGRAPLCYTPEFMDI